MCCVVSDVAEFIFLPSMTSLAPDSTRPSPTTDKDTRHKRHVMACKPCAGWSSTMVSTSLIPSQPRLHLELPEVACLPCLPSSTALPVYSTLFLTAHSHPHTRRPTLLRLQETSCASETPLELVYIYHLKL